jgi:hypothetical protein
MAKLFGRRASLTVGSTKVSGLRIAFKVTQSPSKEPDTLEASIYNLTQDTRAKMSAAKATVELTAGYQANLDVIFRGDLRRAFTVAEGPDRITKIYAGDGEVAFRTGRINKAYKPGSGILDVIEDVAKSLKVDNKDAIDRIRQGKFREGLTQFFKGKSVSGNTADALDELLRGLGYQYSIQDGQLVVVPEDESTEHEAVALSPISGLIGSPEAGEDGRISITSLLQPRLKPFRKLKLESLLLNGFYRVEKAIHTGDTHGAPWYTQVEARPL